jgi:hypothetical protein
MKILLGKFRRILSKDKIWLWLMKTTRSMGLLADLPAPG